MLFQVDEVEVLTKNNKNEIHYSSGVDSIKALVNSKYTKIGTRYRNRGKKLDPH